MKYLEKVTLLLNSFGEEEEEMQQNSFQHHMSI